MTHRFLQKAPLAPVNLILVLSTFLYIALPPKSSYAADTEESKIEWRDPLSTRPPQLDIGPILPGDSAPLSCVPPDPERIQNQVLSLEAAVDIGMCANPQVRNAWAAIKMQAAALGEARAGYLPVVSAGISHVEDRTSFPNSSLNAAQVQGESQSIGMNWRLLDFGGRKANNSAAVATLNVALANHSAVLQKTLEVLISAFFDAQTAQALLQSRLTNESLARTTLETTQRREKQGAGAQTDTLQATTSLARAALDRSRAHGDYLKALATLRYALGVEPGTPLQLASELESSSLDLELDLQSWLQQARSGHPAILAAQYQVEAIRSKVIAIQSEGLPSVDLSANIYQNGRPNQGLASTLVREDVVSVTLNIPLFEGFGRTYKVRGAVAQLEQVQATLDDVSNQVLMNTTKTYVDAKVALDNLDASNNLLQAAQNALASVQRKFDRGASDVLEVLTTQSTFAEAQQQRIRCLSDWRSARLRLLASVGRLGHAALTSPITQ